MASPQNGKFKIKNKELHSKTKSAVANTCVKYWY